MAAEMGRVEAVKALLNSSLEIKYKSPESLVNLAEEANVTALMRAAQNGNAERSVGGWWSGDGQVTSG